MTEKGFPIQREDALDHSVHFIRHSRASYRTYGEISQSKNPMALLDPENQVMPDLTESGVALAKEEAEKFFSTLNPDQDTLFFVSSNEARAIETANIYREVSYAKGFEVLIPEHVRSGVAEKIGEGEIRVIRGLSINSSTLLLDSVFTPPSKRAAVNWSEVDPIWKARYEEASKIIEADDRGSFGANFSKHGEAIKKIFPELQTAKDLYESQFKNLKRLAVFGLKKAKEHGEEKYVKILAFGHENYMLHALELLFQEEGIQNCEMVRIVTNGDTLTAEFRGKTLSL